MYEAVFLNASIIFLILLFFISQEVISDTLPTNCAPTVGKGGKPSSPPTIGKRGANRRLGTGQHHHQPPVKSPKSDPRKDRRCSCGKGYGPPCNPRKTAPPSSGPTPPPISPGPTLPPSSVPPSLPPIDTVKDDDDVPSNDSQNLTNSEVPSNDGESLSTEEEAPSNEGLDHRLNATNTTTTEFSPSNEDVDRKDYGFKDDIGGIPPLEEDDDAAFAVTNEDYHSNTTGEAM